jgi:hypothetical protein
MSLNDMLKIIWRSDMRKVLVPCLVAILALAACGGKKSIVYYPKYHFTAIYAQMGENPGYLNWGDKLVSLGSIISNTNSAGKTIIMIKVRQELTKTEGYVEQDSVVANPVVRGVILNPTISYNTPTLTSINKSPVNPPVLAYVIEIKDGEWARLEPYNAGASYYLPGIEAPKLYDNKWISVKDISTNQMDVNLIIALQFAARKYNESKKSYDAVPNDANKKKFDDAMKVEADSLRKVLELYPKADPNAFNQAQKFLDLVSPPEQNPGDAPAESPSNTNSDSL